MALPQNSANGIRWLSRGPQPVPTGKSKVSSKLRILVTRGESCEPSKQEIQIDPRCESGEWHDQHKKVRDDGTRAARFVQHGRLV